MYGTRSGLTAHVPRLIAVVSCWFFLGTHATAAFAQQGSTIRNVDAREIFVPKGFDDNDQILIVIDGFLPDTCFRVLDPVVAVDRVANLIKITPRARHYQIDCLETPVPFDFEVRLDPLPWGEYRVEALGAPAASLSVAESMNAGPDDFLYAPVDQVVFELFDTGFEAYIKGRFPDSCYFIDHFRTFDHDKTIEVLPIMDRQDRNDCVEGEFPYFAYIENFPLRLSEGRHLLHVRSLNGKDVSTLFSVP